MEDAHHVELDLDVDTSFFAVFDGHGGSEARGTLDGRQGAPSAQLWPASRPVLTTAPRRSARRRVRSDRIRCSGPCCRVLFACRCACTLRCAKSLQFAKGGCDRRPESCPASGDSAPYETICPGRQPRPLGSPPTRPPGADEGACQHTRDRPGRPSARGSMQSEATALLVGAGGQVLRVESPQGVKGTP